MPLTWLMHAHTHAHMHITQARLQSWTSVPVTAHGSTGEWGGLAHRKDMVV